MRRLFKFSVLVVLLGLVAIAVLALLALQDKPLVTDVGRLTPAQIFRATQLLRANDPRKLKTGQVNRITVREEEIALAGSYALNRLGFAGTKVHIEDARLTFDGTLEIPKNPVGRYVNVEAVVSQGTPLPEFVSLKIGRLPISDWLANHVLDRAMIWLYADKDAHAVLQMIRAVQLRPGRMQVTYRWQEDVVKRLRMRVVPEADKVRLRTYNDALVRIARGLSARPQLGELLAPLLELAGERGRDEDAPAENRAALLVLEAYVNNRNLGVFIPEFKTWAKPKRLVPVIEGRRDFPQHFMTSAVLAALGDAALSDAVGLYKEVDDSRGGSGFSFTDLAADRAGTRFGELCVRSVSSASRMQQAATDGLNNGDLMPPVLDLPEHMSESVFARRFGGTNDARYKKVFDEIERRISTLSLYR
ncbi:MAG: hypothetical protein ACI9DC_003624 [Gammaproteobacteria bacterium]|jgi:hypothetical protein